MRGNCERCFKETNVTTMSFFNTQIICIDCSKKEKQHKDFEKAREIEFNEIKKGNLNFEGIGLPKDF